jgi:hypothetical protein
MGDGLDKIPESEVRQEYEKWATDGLIAEDKVFTFLREVTRANNTDADTGRMWKAQMVLLMRTVGICGYVNTSGSDDSPAARSTAKFTEDQFVVDEDEGDQLVEVESFDALATYTWPGWLEQIWSEMAPGWSLTGEGTDGSGCPRPFLPKPEIHKFFVRVAFSRTERLKREEMRADLQIHLKRSTKTMTIG